MLSTTLGDTVWWHPDLVHAVEKKHSGHQNSSVFYIPAGLSVSEVTEVLEINRCEFMQDHYV